MTRHIQTHNPIIDGRPGIRVSKVGRRVSDMPEQKPGLGKIAGIGRKLCGILLHVDILFSGVR